MEKGEYGWTDDLDLSALLCFLLLASFFSLPRWMVCERLFLLAV